jgi:hypothetical protein
MQGGLSAVEHVNLDDVGTDDEACVLRRYWGKFLGVYSAEQTA